MEGGNKDQANLSTGDVPKGAGFPHQNFKEPLIVQKGVVEVHTCYSIDFGDPRPVSCACRKTVSIERAKELIKNGFAEWVIGYDRPKPYHDGGKICMTGRASQTPRGATIEKAHIERAYVKGDLEEQTRITEYGIMTRDMFKSLTVGYPEWQFDEMRDRDYGVPVLYFPNNGRTAGGIGKYTFDEPRRDK